MVFVMKPTLDDIIQDPAAGTGGFPIAANHYLRSHYDFDSLTEAQQKKYQSRTFFGMEHVQDTHRLAMMNLMLHGIEGGIRYGDTLSDDGTTLTNCPKGGRARPSARSLLIRRSVCQELPNRSLTSTSAPLIATPKR